MEHATSGKTLRRLYAYFTPHKLLLFLAFIFVGLFSLVDAGMIYFVQPLIDEGLAKQDSAVLKLSAVIIMGIFLLRGVASFCSAYAIAYVGNLVIFQLRQQIFDHLQALPMSFFAQNTSGELISKMTYDAEQVSRASAEAAMILVRESLIILVLVAIMVNASWQLSLIFLLVGPVILALITMVARRFKKVSHGLQNIMGTITQFMEQSVRGHKDIILYGTQGQESEGFVKPNNLNRQYANKLATVSALSNPVIQLIASGAIAAVLFLASMPQVISELSVGAFTTVLVAMGSLLRPLKLLSQVNQQLQRGIAAAESLFKVLDEKPENNRGNLIACELGSGIQIRNLRFTHDSDSPYLFEGIDLFFDAQKVTVILGQSGCGKSTLMDLILRVYEAPENAITFGCIPIEQYDLQAYRRQFSVVSQQPFLINGSVFDNLVYGCIRMPEQEKLWEVLEAVQLKQTVEQFPAGLDEGIGENGSRLSGGQKQRLALARALLADRQVLILDEATSALDKETERLTWQGIFALREGQTTIIVTHRRSCLPYADKVYHLTPMGEEGEENRLTLVECASANAV